MYNFSSTKGEHKMRFKLKTEVIAKFLSIMMISNVRYVGIAKTFIYYSEGYVFEVINSLKLGNRTFKLDNSENSVAGLT